jgi:hypothetical protein
VDDLPTTAELASLRALTVQLRTENARLLRLLELTDVPFSEHLVLHQKS